mgnify:CR=1 FL=1|jgi:1-acyl-sn-glycerol-3-phosphate acyltransferase
MSDPIQRTLAQRYGYHLSRYAAQLLVVSISGLRCEGRYHVPKTGPVLVCSNHQSFFDPVLIGLGCRRRLNFLARNTLFNHRLFGQLIRFFDAIPIERDGMGISGIKETIKRLRRDEMVLMFPEGTRTPDGEFQALRPGFCSLARRGETTLQPVALDGAYQCWPRQARYPKLGRLAIVFGPPLKPADFADWNNDQLLAELAHRMQVCHQRARHLRSLGPLAP